MPLTLEKPAVFPRQPWAAAPALAAQARKPSASPQTLPPPKKDSLHFGIHNPQWEIDQVFEQLKKEQPHGLVEKIFKSVPYVASDAVLKKRAAFEVTGERDVLNGLLPYRDKLTRNGDSKALTQYDQLVNTIAQRCEVLDLTTSPQRFRKALQNADLQNRVPKKWQRFLIHALKWLFAIPAVIINFFKFLKNLKRESRNTEHMAQMQAALDSKHPLLEKDLKKLIAKHTRPNTKIATRYFLAAQIAELLHRKPDMAESALRLLNEKPLRILIGKNRPWIFGGFYAPGAHLIQLNEHALWSEKVVDKLHAAIAQHEFLHAMSVDAGMACLPQMSEAQKSEFTAARTELETMFDREFDGFWGLFKNKACQEKLGFRNYAFYNHAEFLTVTLDTFKTKPEALKTTEPGRKLYNLYRELFGLDPANELPQQAPPPAKSGNSPYVPPKEA